MALKSRIDDPAVRSRIVELVRRHNYVATAAESCGVSADTVHQWLHRGRVARGKYESGEAITASEEVYAEFHDEVAQARALSEQHHVEHVTESGDVKCSQWLLERKYPKRWGATLAIASESEMERFLRRIQTYLPKDLYERVLSDAANVSADERSAEAPGGTAGDDDRV